MNRFFKFFTLLAVALFAFGCTLEKQDSAHISLTLPVFKNEVSGSADYTAFSISVIQESTEETIFEQTIYSNNAEIEVTPDEYYTIIVSCKKSDGTEYSGSTEHILAKAGETIPVEITLYKIDFTPIPDDGYELQSITAPEISVALGSTFTSNLVKQITATYANSNNETKTVNVTTGFTVTVNNEEAAVITTGTSSYMVTYSGKAAYGKITVNADNPQITITNTTAGTMTATVTAQEGGSITICWLKLGNSAQNALLALADIATNRTNSTYIVNSNDTMPTCVAQEAQTVNGKVQKVSTLTYNPQDEENQYFICWAMNMNLAVNGARTATSHSSAQKIVTSTTPQDITSSLQNASSAIELYITQDSVISSPVVISSSGDNILALATTATADKTIYRGQSASSTLLTVNSGTKLTIRGSESKTLIFDGANGSASAVIAVSGGTLTLANDVQIQNNTNSNASGAIQVTNGGTLTLQGTVTMSENSNKTLQNGSTITTGDIALESGTINLSGIYNGTIYYNNSDSFKDTEKTINIYSDFNSSKSNITVIIHSFAAQTGNNTMTLFTPVTGNTTGPDVTGILVKDISGTAYTVSTDGKISVQ